MNSKTVFTNLIWRFAERSGAQLVKFCVELILARILLPDDYGLIALVTVFITISNVFVDSGLGNALIQKKDADQTDFSTVFFFNLVWCLILYGLLFFLAPVIASSFSQPEFSAVLRVLGLQINHFAVCNSFYITAQWQMPPRLPAAVAESCKV